MRRRENGIVARKKVTVTGVALRVVGLSVLAAGLVATASASMDSMAPIVPQEYTSLTPAFQTSAGPVADIDITHHVTERAHAEPQAGIVPWTYLVSYTWTRQTPRPALPVCNSQVVEMAINTMDGRQIKVPPRELGCEGTDVGESVRFTDVVNTDQGPRSLLEAVITVKSGGKTEVFYAELEPA